ncbi:MAG TPA: zf-HC2 domain-containing protein [Kofleriaceae bacterium]|jgi:hypothetical protein
MLDCSKIDELMMDWLYRELDESSSARVAEHVEGCARCAAEATALQRTRAAFRDLSPVDPPVAVSAILLHEAARRAPAAAAPRAAAAEGGFWATVRSWFRPIALHPAAAAIATLVLIAGVAGTLYVRHGDEMTDTQNLEVPATDTASAAATTDAPAAAEEAPEVPKAEPVVAAQATPADEANDDDQDGYRADLLGKEAQAELSRETAEHRFEGMTRDADAAKQLSAERKVVPTTKGGKKKAKPAADPKGPIANAVSGADPLIEGEADLRGGTLGNARGRASDKLEQAAKPPPSTPPASTGSTSSAPPVQTPGGGQGSLDFEDSTVRGDSGGSYRAYKQKPMSQSELKSNEGKLGTAMKKKDCVTAARIANDILDRNTDYYYKRVASQTKPCQMAVNVETKNRSARRASKNVGSGKNVAAPQKMKAAKQKDQASEAAE